MTLGVVTKQQFQAVVQNQPQIDCDEILCSAISNFSTRDRGKSRWTYNSDFSMRLSEHLDPLATVQRTVTSDLPYQVHTFPTNHVPILYMTVSLCIQDNILLFPWADFAILIPGIRHSYVKQVFQYASLAHRLFNTDCLLCFGVSAISYQMTSAHVRWSRRWSSRLLLKAHFVTINDMFHGTTTLRSCVGTLIF